MASKILERLMKQPFQSNKQKRGRKPNDRLST